MSVWLWSALGWRALWAAIWWLEVQGVLSKGYMCGATTLQYTGMG